jgi:NADH:ubiquinone oxidoreductase subunit 6 (subunit J)
MSIDNIIIYSAAVGTFFLAAIVLLRAARLANSYKFWKSWFVSVVCVLGAALIQILSFEMFQTDPQISLRAFLFLESEHRGRLLETYALLLALLASGFFKIITNYGRNFRNR